MMGTQSRSSQGTGSAVAAAKRTVSASSASTPAILLTAVLTDEDSAFARSILKTTSALVKGVPSWNMTPRRSSISQVVELSHFQLVASFGSSHPSRS
jgi:hypothetical protein